MDRIYFLNKENRKDFFDEVKNNLMANSWKKLAAFLETSRSMIDKYRIGELCLPQNKFLVLLDLLPSDRKEYFSNLIEKKAENWGQIIGGKKAYKINKKEFDRGRIIGSKALKVRGARYNFDVHMPLSEELCEFIGAIIGDGFTNEYDGRYQTQITGDSRYDAIYYYETLKPICEKLFQISPKIKQKENTIRLNIYSKNLFEMLTKRFKIPRGKKGHFLKIPREIMESKENLLNHTLRGMFDTDGGIGLDKRKTYKKPYIRINYTSISRDLIEQIHQRLISYEIPHSIHEKMSTLMIQINGQINVKKFISKIGFSNKRHLDKLKDTL